LDKYSEEYKIDTKTRKKAEEIFREYLSHKENSEQVLTDNFQHCSMRSSILIASKCQFHYTLDNVMVRGAGLSVT